MTECDGSRECQASEHIEGCFATTGPIGSLHKDAAEIRSLRRRLRGIVLDRDALQVKLDRITAAMQDAADTDPVTCRQRVRRFLDTGGQ